MRARARARHRRDCVPRVDQRRDELLPDDTGSASNEDSHVARPQYFVSAGARS